MVDIVTPDVRSRMMAAIGGTNTRPEIALRKTLHARGVRFRLHRKDLPGSPDLVFPRYRAVAFVHGCFWHRHLGCRYATTPSTRPEFWQAKFDANVARDYRAIEDLGRMGWRVAIVWECAIRSRLPEIARDLVAWLAAESEPGHPDTIDLGQG
ncbi:DNA mismatch endonuclease Vsr [Frigidibacter albus]|uniref:Very short patch repair endonuclease n=1 Tax=Frigidibacter albus TaxID=1465486 RepID=A0A6L8VFR2_9RHOB|nr:very short patch repair endonuclease [Frigidibacter albus]MZQ89197.1 DNA mismatch endonuclease Vsr [Frigidibacter albus]NBE30746.1 DNA mismatch endonuclease Vsr [Frigidibacter albus]GGH50813.1 very short patch repair endonuclease [Frigidibacter albus]